MGGSNLFLEPSIDVYLDSFASTLECGDQTYYDSIMSVNRPVAQRPASQPKYLAQIVVRVSFRQRFSNGTCNGTSKFRSFFSDPASIAIDT